MSFQHALNQAIAETINGFIQKVSTTFSVDKEALNSLWNDSNVEVKAKTKEVKTKIKVEKEKPVEKPAENEQSQKVLLNLKKTELVDMAKARNLSHTGTKEELVARLTGVSPSSKKESTKTESTKKESVKESSKEKVKQTKITSVPKVTPITKSQPIEIKANKFKNYEHTESGLVFDNINGKVIGHQNSNGSVSDLTDADIDQCKKYGFNFNMPSNLNKKESVEDVGEDDEDELDNTTKPDDDEELDENVEDFLDDDAENFEDDDGGDDAE